jgi:hypothetical protein
MYVPCTLGTSCPCNWPAANPFDLSKCQPSPIPGHYTTVSGVSGVDCNREMTFLPLLRSIINWLGLPNI